MSKAVGKAVKFLAEKAIGAIISSAVGYGMNELMYVTGIKPKDTTPQKLDLIISKLDEIQATLEEMRADLKKIEFTIKHQVMFDDIAFLNQELEKGPVDYQNLYAKYYDAKSKLLLYFSEESGNHATIEDCVCYFKNNGLMLAGNDSFKFRDLFESWQMSTVEQYTICLGCSEFLLPVKKQQLEDAIGASMPSSAVDRLKREVSDLENDAQTLVDGCNLFCQRFFQAFKDKLPGYLELWKTQTDLQPSHSICARNDGKLFAYAITSIEQLLLIEDKGSQVCCSVGNDGSNWGVHSTNVFVDNNNVIHTLATNSYKYLRHCKYEPKSVERSTQFSQIQVYTSPSPREEYCTVSGDHNELVYVTSGCASNVQVERFNVMNQLVPIDTIMKIDKSAESHCSSFIMNNQHYIVTLDDLSNHSTSTIISSDSFYKYKVVSTYDWPKAWWTVSAFPVGNKIFALYASRIGGHIKLCELAPNNVCNQLWIDENDKYFTNKSNKSYKTNMFSCSSCVSSEVVLGNEHYVINIFWSMEFWHGYSKYFLFKHI